jgi:hypothetical protein
MPELDIIKSCKAIDFKAGRSFSLAIQNPTFTTAQVSLFDIDKAFTLVGNTWLVITDDAKTMLITGNVSYGYLMNNCSTNRPAWITGFRISTNRILNFATDVRIVHRNINGNQITEPYSVITELDIFQKEAFADINLSSKRLYLTGDRMLKFPIVSRSTITLLFSYSLPPDIETYKPLVEENNDKKIKIHTCSNIENPFKD